MDRDHGSHQFGMDFLSLQLSVPGGPDALSGFVAGNLRFAYAERKPVSPGRSLGVGLRNRADDDRRSRSLVYRRTNVADRPSSRGHRAPGPLALVLASAPLR